MILRFTDGTNAITTRGKLRGLTFVKEGTPGARRWYVQFVRKGGKVSEKRPVRDLSYVVEGRKG